MKNQTIQKTIRFGFRSMLLLVLAGVLAGNVISVQAEGSNAEKVKAALKVMREEAAKLGEPKAEGSGLFFGTTKMNGNYTIVDALKAQFSCTATFFTKKGTDYVRISTNVLNDGNRAVGTVLNLGPGQSTTTTDSSTKFIAGAKVDTTVTAESVALHRGRTTMVWQTSIRNADGKLCAVVSQTQLVMTRG